jgi:hypothetical protein
MRIVDLTIQGVRRFPTLHKLTLDGQSAWVRMPAGGGRSTVASLIRAALDPTWFLAVQESLVPWRPQSDAIRFALTIETGDRRHRIMRDGRSGAVAAGRWQDEGSTFVAAAQTPEAVAAILADDHDFPGPADWADLCFWSEAAGSAPATAAATVVDAQSIRAQLEELLNEKSLMQNADETQFELDGLEQKRFALDEEIRKLGERLAARDRLSKEYERTEELEQAGERLIGVAGDHDRLLDRYQQQRIQRETALETQEETLAEMRAKPLWHKDKIFIGIAAGAVLGLIVPVVLKVYAASLLGFFGFGALGWWAWRTRQHIDATAAAEQAFAKARGDLADWISRQDHEFAEVARLLERFGVIKPSDLKQRWDSRKTLGEKLATLDRELASEGVAARIRAAEEERKAVTDRVARIEQTMEENLGGAGRDVGEIEREIAALERQLKMATAGAAVGAAAPMPGGPSRSPRERISAALRAAARLARRDPAAATAALQPTASKIVAAVLPGVIQEIELQPDGAVTWLGPGKAPLDPRAVHRGIELVTAAAVIVAGARAAAQTRSFPIVWDEPFADLDDVTLGRLGQVLPKAGAGLQFVALSGRQALGAPLGRSLDLA